MSRVNRCFSITVLTCLVCIICQAGNNPVRVYDFLLHQKILENSDAFRNSNSPGHFNITDYSAKGTLVVTYCSEKKIFLKAIYTDSYSGSMNTTDTVNAILIINTTGINSFFTSPAITNNHLFFIKKIISFIQVFKEESISQSYSPQKENYYDGFYLSRYWLKEKKGEHTTYEKSIEKANNHQLSNTRTIIDKYISNIIFEKKYLKKISVLEEKRQKFGAIILSKITSNFLLNEKAADIHIDEVEATDYENAVIEQAIFKRLSKVEKKKLTSGTCIQGMAFHQVIKALENLAKEVPVTERKYLCQIAAVYYHFPDSAFLMERLFNETIQPELKMLMLRGAVESAKKEAHNFIASILDTVTNDEITKELLIQISSLGYTESIKLLQSLLKITNINNINSNTSKLCMANIAFGIKETQPMISFLLKEMLYNIFNTSQKHLADSLSYLNQIANAGDIKRSFIIAQLSHNLENEKNCINALYNMPDSIVLKILNSFNKQKQHRLTEEIINLLFTFYPTLSIREYLFQLSRNSESNVIKEKVTQFLYQFKDEIVTLDVELKNI